MEIDYEKAYKEALERARRIKNGEGDWRYSDLIEIGPALTEIFPGLAESEDERIRKLLVWQVYRNIEDETNDLAQSVYDGIKGHDPDLEESIEDWKKCLAYLEKQKEQPTNEEMLRTLRTEYEKGVADTIAKYEQKEQKPTEYLSKRKVYDIMNKLTELSTSDLIPFESEEYVRIHEITSDVCSLLDYPIKPVEWNEYDKACINNIVLLLDGNGKYVPDGARQQYLEWFNQHRIAFQNRSVEWSKEDEKIRKEIRDLLVNACEADRRYPKLLAWLESPRQVQNPEWNNLDKGILNDAITAVDLLGNDESFNKGNPNLAKAFRIAKDWLKSLPERFNLQPKQEWSEEDERKRQSCISTINEVIDYERERWEDYNPGKPYRPIMKYDEQIDWLKSLRPSWKPSKEQMEALRSAVNKLAKTDVADSVRLSIMYDNLKKLM